MLKRVMSFMHNEPSQLASGAGYKKLDLDASLELLEPTLKPLASFFYKTLDKLMPQSFSYSWDRNAPDNPNPHMNNRFARAAQLSLELSINREGKHLKYGTARVAERDKHFFAKTVTWQTPKDFLHHFEVYQLIKEHYYDCKITKNRSKTAQGFRVSNKNQIITLEVFGANEHHGYLACDITLCRFNQPLTCKRINRFLEFYGSLYNMLNNPDLNFKTTPVSNVEFPELPE